MNLGSRPSSPSGNPVQPTAALPPPHEGQATLTVSASPSPVPPTPPPKDYPSPETDHSLELGTASTAAATMSKLGVKAAHPDMYDPPESIVIDISGPVDSSSTRDPDATIRVDTDGDTDELPRDSDLTDADITIVQPGRRSDSPEHGGSTLYGSGAGGDSERETVQQHPLRLDIHPPSPPHWDKDLESGRGGADDDDDLGRRSGRASPQRFVFSAAKSQRVHDFGRKPRSRPLIPHSAYYFGPPPPDSAYGTEPCGQIGVHHPREVVRIERDYTGGELPQFTPTYPLELEGRLTPTQFLETINAINEILLSAHSLSHAFVDNALAYFSLQLSRAVKKTHYEKEMDRLHTLIDELNAQIYNPLGLHIRWPRSVAFLFLEIEYYVCTFSVLVLRSLIVTPK